MTSILCYHCKNKHASVAVVKACANLPKPVMTLDDVLGTDVNPDPKALLDAWQAKIQQENAAIDATFAAKVETGKIVETVIPAKVTVASVPAHRKDPKYLALKALQNPAAPVVEMVKIPGLDISVPAPANFLAGVGPECAPSTVKKGQDLELGMYQITAENGVQMIYKIKWNKTNTYKYAEKLVITDGKWSKSGKPSGKFMYAGSMMNKLTSENKMTEEQAKAFHDATKAKYGVDYGFCCVCGKLLTVKKSIDKGIGPVCETKF